MKRNEMFRRKKILVAGILTAVVLGTAVVPVYAQEQPGGMAVAVVEESGDISGENFEAMHASGQWYSSSGEWELWDSGLRRYYGNGSNLVIPSEIDGVKISGVTSNTAFSGKTLSGTLTIQEGITYLSASAFSGQSKLTGDLTIPSGMTKVQGYTFYNCSGFDGTLTIPSSVTSIDTGAFKGCSGFSKIVNYSNTRLSASDFAQTGTAFVNASTGKIVTDLPRGTYLRVKIVANVSLNQNLLNLSIGDTYQLKVAVEPADARDKTVTWSSSNYDVASVDDKGLVTAKGSGQAVITVTAVDGGKADVCTVNACSYVTMQRLYNPNSGEHFYTGSRDELDNLVKAGWQHEGGAWNAPDFSDTPVYRLYNPNAGDHHYTSDETERENLVNAGWKYEGICWYSDGNHTTPLYRLYNPNTQTAGAHHYTASEAERDNLVKIGWKLEGIGWFGGK